MLSESETHKKTTVENNNLRNPGVPYAVNGGTPSPATPAPTPLFADAVRSTPPALSGINPATPTAMPIQAPVPSNPMPAAQQPLSQSPPAAAPPGPKKPRDWRKTSKRIGIVTLVLLLIGGGILVFDRLRNQPEQTGSVNSDIASANIPLSEFASSGSLSLLGTQSLTVNGQLRANESFVLAPQNQPTNGERGQIYYDNTSNQLAYYNGSQFIKLPGTNFVQTFQGQSGNVTLTAGNGLTINGTTFTNSGVTSVGGQTGDITLGNGLSIAGGSLQATGIQSLASGSPTLSITNDGTGNLTITSTGAGTGTVTSAGGTNGQIPLFTGTQNIENSIISQSGGTITVAGNLNVTGTTTLTTPLSVANGGTGANSLTANGVIVGNGTSAFSSVAAGGAGLCLMSTVGTPTWAACPGGGGGVTSLDGLTGALSLANSTGSGSTVTINDASTSQKGIAQFNSTNFSAAGGVVNTIQDIAVSSAPTFGRLTLTSNQATNPMLLVNNTNGSGSGNLIDLQVAGISKMAITPAGAMTLTGTLNGQTISSAANFTGSLAVASAASLNGGASVTGTLTANTITPTAAMTVGATNQTLTLQGSASTTVSATNGANTTTVSFQTPTANVSYRLLTAAAGTYDICTTVGNCVGTGGGVTTPGGTTNTLPKFTGPQTLGDSIISDNGTTVTIGGTLAVSTITPSGAMTIGSTSQNLTLQGAATTKLTATNGGITNSLTFATASGSNKTITIPNATGTLVVSASAPLSIDVAGNISCPTCTTGTVVNSLDGLTGVLTLANSSGSGGTVTINDASTSQKGIAQFNSTNFSAASGVVNTIQDIAVSAAPTFGRLTVTSSQATNGMLLVNNTNAGASGNLLDLQLNSSSKLAVTPAGAMTLVGTLNGQTISSSANFTGTLGVAGLASLNAGATVTGTLTANNLTPTSALTVGVTTQSFTVQGSASSTITATNGANTTTVSFQTPTASVNYRLLTAAAGTYDICTTVGNCSGVGGGVTTAGGTINNLAKFTASGAIGDSIITDNGTTVTVGGTLAVNTITPSAAMTIGSTSQNLTLQGAVTKLTATNGGITNTLQFATPAGSNKTITLPNATGTVAVSASGPLAVDAAGNITCATCVTSGGGGGGVGAVDSLDGLTGALTIANSSGTGATITINDASTSQKGIAQFNSTNLSVSGGVANTIQDIAVTSAPTFGRLTVTSSQATNPMLLVNNTNVGASGNLLDLQLNGASKLSVTPAGAMTLVGALNGQTVSSAASFTGTLAVASQANLNGGAAVTGTLSANTITPTSSLTVGATNQSFLVQGSAASTITATNGANTTTLAFQTPTAAVTYRFLTAAAGTYDVCTTVGNCLGVGGGVTTAGGTINKLAKFTTSSAIGDSIITDNGSTVTIGGTLAVNTLTPTAALTVGATSQNLTLQGATTNLTSTSSGITNTLTFAAPTSTGKTITIPDASGTLVVSASGPLAISAAGNITCATCATTSTSVASLDGLTGVLTLANSSGVGTNITIDDASTSQKGIAQFNSTNFSATGGAVNTVQNINTGATPTFAGVNTNTITPSSALTLGATTQSFTLQGSATSTITATGGGFATIVGFTGTPTGLVTYNFDRTATPNTYTICTTAGNCSGSGVSSIGVINSQTKSANGAVISGSSLVLQTADASFPGLVSTGSQTFGGAKTFDSNTIINGSATNALTVLSSANGSGAIILNLEQNDNDSVLRVTDTGTLAIGNGTNVAGTIALGNGAGGQFGEIKATNLTGARAYELPNSSGTFCLDNGNCGSATGTLQAAYDFSTGGITPEIKLSNVNNGIEIQDANTTLGSSQNFLSLRGPNGSGLGSVLVGFGMQGNLFMQPSTNRTDLIDVNNNTGNNVFTVDSATSTGRVGIALGGSVLPGTTLDVGGDGRFSGNLTVNGSAQFKNSTDSTTGFNVLNSSSQAMFTIDTVSAAVKIGGGDVSASTSPALLVLDYKTNAGDPTGVAGAMYYNSSTQQFRCYRSINGTDGNWEACGTNPIDRGFEVNEEFLGGASVNSADLSEPQGIIGELGWTTNSLGAATFSYNTGMAVTADHPGIIEIQTPLTANRGSTLTLNGDGANSTIIGAGNDVKMAVGFDSALDNLVFRGGLHGQLATSTRPVSGVWWEAAQTVNANWQYCYGNGTTATCASSGIAIAATTWYRLEMRVNTTGSSTSSVDYFINGTKFSVSGVTVDTTNAVNPALACWTTAASDRYCDIDYFQFHGIASAAR